MPRYYYAGFGADVENVAVQDPGGGMEIEVSLGKGPFYTAADPVQAFLKAIQKVLGVPTTGVWDKETHNAFWAWVMAREVLTSPGGISDMPSVLPYKPRVCTSDGFPPSMDGTDCTDTAGLITEIMDDVLEDPSFVTALGWASADAMFADATWQAVRTSVATKIIMHVQNKLTEGVSPISPPEPPPPPTEPPVEPEAKKAGVGWIVGGILLAVGIGWLVTSKAE